MLKETETEKTIVFFVTFLSFVAFHLGWGPGSLARPMRVKEEGVIASYLLSHNVQQNKIVSLITL